MYNEIKFNLYTMDQAGEPIHSPNVLSALNRLRQISVATPQVNRDYFDEKEQRRKQEIALVEPSSKLDALMEIIAGLEWDEERKDQVVVFSNFRDPIELAKARFEKAGISYIHMEQKDNDQQRYNKWAIEFPKKNHQVFICTLQLGSESISLTSATTCVFLDRSWSPKDNEQGVSRVWRPGQEGVANIIHINALNTTDQRVFESNRTKIGWFKEIFGEEETVELEEKVSA
jgi:SNF2 family DNA or RNA helicase